LRSTGRRPGSPGCRTLRRQGMAAAALSQLAARQKPVPGAVAAAALGRCHSTRPLRPALPPTAPSPAREPRNPTCPRRGAVKVAAGVGVLEVCLVLVDPVAACILADAQIHSVVPAWHIPAAAHGAAGKESLCSEQLPALGGRRARLRLPPHLSSSSAMVRRVMVWGEPA
jgi:hypothetical protein